MITKAILILTLILMTLTTIINFIPKERVVVNTKENDSKEPFYTKEAWNGEKDTYYNYEFAGSAKYASGETYYIYNKYQTKYKWDNVNWLYIHGLTKGLAIILSVVLAFMVLAYGIVSLNNSKRLDSLEHQTQYVATLNEEVDVIVKSFMEHEEITFDRDISLEALVITYPELRSVELVTNQLNTLKEEKQKLNEMELQTIRFKTTQKWFGLFVGKGE